VAGTVRNRGISGKKLEKTWFYMAKIPPIARRVPRWGMGRMKMEEFRFSSKVIIPMGGA